MRCTEVCSELVIMRSTDDIDTDMTKAVEFCVVYLHEVPSLCVNAHTVDVFSLVFFKAISELCVLLG